MNSVYQKVPLPIYDTFFKQKYLLCQRTLIIKFFSIYLLFFFPKDVWNIPNSDATFFFILFFLHTSRVAQLSSYVCGPRSVDIATLAPFLRAKVLTGLHSYVEAQLRKILLPNCKGCWQNLSLCGGRLCLIPRGSPEVIVTWISPLAGQKMATYYFRSILSDSQQKGFLYMI